MKINAINPAQKNLKDYSMELSKIFFLFCLSLWLFGCQNLEKESCRSKNWRNHGLNSAQQGFTIDESLKSAQTCSRYKVSIDETSIQEGYQEGLQSFCKTKVAFEKGQEGHIYQNICPKHSNKAFLKGYLRGRLLFLNEKSEEIRKLYDQAEDRLWRKEREYTLLKSEDPEQAKLLKASLEAYREETAHLANEKKKIKKSLKLVKRSLRETAF